MAELPDLSVFAVTLNKRFKGKVLKALEIKHHRKLNTTPAELKQQLENHKLIKVERSGKTLQFIFGQNRILGLHLMLRGELQAISEQEPLPEYTILAFFFTGGQGFAVTDTLKQATPTFMPPANKVPDALKISKEEFIRLLGRRKKTIKEVLMDQKALRGIGNSYGDEILWVARISPLSIANKIPEKQVSVLFNAIAEVLNKAIKDIASENGDELKGELRDFMKIHGARLKQSPTGAKVNSVKIGGRTAYFTDEQHLYP